MNYSAGEKAAIRMQKERGCVIVGYAPEDASVCSPGMMLTAFAGAALKFHKLLVVGPSIRKEWDAQAMAMGGQQFVDEHPPQEGQAFFVCSLVRI